MKKKLLSFFLIISAFVFNVSALEKISEFVLENGMNVFVAEDFSSAIVRVEYTAKAGFSKQNIDTAGFFPLYSRLLKYASPLDKKILSELDFECNADSSRYVITCTPDEFNLVLGALSNAVFNPVFQDEDLERELSALKKEVSENAFSVEGFINSSIDSRVFSESPWKHDSGIYPVLFSKTTTAGARQILSNIQEKFYTPKNSAVFISGPVKKEYALELAQKYFGKIQFLKNYNQALKSDGEDLPEFKTDSELEQKKLFVLSDPEFSPDMTQVVVQYTDLTMTECDFLSAIMESDSSKLKQELLKNSSFGIRSSQYVSASSTHKNGSSRLIIQSLLENRSTSPCKNSVGFASTIKQSVDLISQEDFDNAKTALINSFYKSISSSSDFMNMLSQFWAVKDFAQSELNENALTLSDLFFLRVQELESQTLNSLKDRLNNSTPFVFVLENSKRLEKFKKEFEKENFEIVTAKNGSWYTQELYKNLKSNVEKEKSVQTESEKSQADFFVQNVKEKITSLTLQNKIPVVINKKDFTNTVCFCAVISGGELFDSKNEYGMQGVLTDLLALNFQNEIYRKYLEKQISSFYEVQSQTDLKSSAISAECLSEDLPAIIEAFADALIFSENPPAVVDSIVMQKKSFQIVKTSSPVFQLKSNAVSSLFKNKDYQTVFSLNKEILKKITYTQVLESYSKLLNAGRYKIIIAGNCGGNLSEDLFEENLSQVLNQTLGLLAQSDFEMPQKYQLNNTAKKSKKIKLTHLFLTDVSKEKAGPRPQVLVPTTDFLDPAQFWIFNEYGDENTELFNAVVYDFVSFVDRKCSEFDLKQKMIVMKEGASKSVPYAVITILNVKDISTVESVLKTALDEYTADLTEDSLLRIKSLWIKEALAPTATNLGTCLLLKKYIEENSADIFGYLNDYEKVNSLTVPQVQQILSSLELENVYKFYSADTKK
ncbi:MAG: insulinase family protein [Treponema sp.]